MGGRVSNEYRRAWNAANPEKVREYQARYNASPKGQENRRRKNAKRRGDPATIEKQKAYRRTERAKELKRAHCAKYRAAGKQHAWRLRSVYGISPEQYEEMLREQNGRCAICGELPRPDERLPVDHSHTTGAVRGLLCHRCNTALGLFNDSMGLLANAAKYIGRFA